ncbi:MAG: DUF6088 family protein [Bacteroidales bacterium]|nr:DUF6088 family protein [Bacteroidales bacterium]MDD6140879.1 DUF6088 family protein [Bacteroidales bacterium]MDD6670191.1 DUF6088 family protein [Bacteroidales bacterium]
MIILFVSLHLKNQQNFKDVMTNKYPEEGVTLRQRIESMSEGCILFRSDFPEYHTEFVGSVLSELTDEGVLVKIAHGIYAKPRNSRFGVLLPSIDNVVQAIAVRDNADLLPSGVVALNALGLSTQVPVIYTYLTSGSERTIQLSNTQVILKRGVPKNFCYRTRLISLLVQALKALKKENVSEEVVNTIRQLVKKETDKATLAKDVDMMPAWMKRIVKPMLTD